MKLVQRKDLALLAILFHLQADSFEELSVCFIGFVMETPNFQQFQARWNVVPGNPEVYQVHCVEGNGFELKPFDGTPWR